MSDRDNRRQRVCDFFLEAKQHARFVRLPLAGVSDPAACTTSPVQENQI